MTLRLGAIDIGTNTVLLTIAEAEAKPTARGTHLVPVLERATITRLGEGVDQTRELAPGAVERTLAALEAYAADLARHGVTRVDAVGTSAMRDAGGGAALRERAAAILGFEPRVIGGLEEARLTFVGGLSGLPHDHARASTKLVFDIGGGSTELIVGDGPSREIRSSTSLDVGSVRLTERHVRSDPPRADELSALDAGIARALEASEPIRAALAGGAFELVGVAGTVTTLAAIARGIDPYDAGRIHGLELRCDELEAVTEQLCAASLEERVRLPGLSPKRADVIVAGARLCLAIARMVGAKALTVSDRGVRWGLLEQLARPFDLPSSR
jgi:exopolyphosphatase/guanosine-5'-triphosphate,3'-diphosphate pyrophosphatase